MSTELSTAAPLIVGALFVGTLVCALVAAAFARRVMLAWKACDDSARLCSSMSSTRAELAELRDAVEKLSKLGRRIEFRDKMAESRARRDEAPPLSNGNMTKQELRRMAGIIPGTYPKHRDG